MYKNPCLMVDAYKLGHFFQMPRGVETIFSTWTARYNKYHNGGECKDTVVFGHQGYIQEYFIEFFNENFFNADINHIEADFKRKVSAVFHPAYTDFSRFRKLHELGYLPIEVWGVPEGTVLPINVPDHIIFNTDPDFAWLPQYLEDIWSCHNWMPSTSATTAYYRRKLLEPYVAATCDSMDVLKHMCGDFSMRGMTGEDAAYVSTCGHLLSFDRTATVEGNGYLEQYYGADLEKNAPGLGVPSLEHSVVCQNVAYYKEVMASGKLPVKMIPYVRKAMNENWEPNLIAEMCFLIRLLTDVQPEGVLTYVSDTYDYWGVVTKVIPAIKDIIMNRKGKLSVRPDSGNPIHIICGDPDAEPGSPQFNGTIFELMKTFGWTRNSKGCKVLPSQIGLIYGDAITAEITKAVGEWCVSREISIGNIAFGIGAYTYQYVTRDTRGYAIKATDAIIDTMGELPLYKQPKTDSAKKSPKGAVAVIKDGRGIIQMVDGLTIDEALHYHGNLMVPKFKDGKMFNIETIYQIRDRLWEAEGF